MAYADMFEEIFSSIDPDTVPMEYVVLAKVIDLQGNERLVRGAELERVLRGPGRAKVAEARVILDVPKIRRAVLDEINAVYAEVNRQVSDIIEARRMDNGDD